MRQQLDRRVEQHGALDALGRECGELEHEPAAERVPDPRRAANAGVVERLEQVVRVGRDRPGRFPLGAAVAAQVRCEHAVAVGQPLLGELAEAAAVRVDAVDAHDRRRAGVAPLVQLEQHQPERAASAGIAASQWMIAPTSAAPASAPRRG